jgi:hypothetical protein
VIRHGGAGPAAGLDRGGVRARGSAAGDPDAFWAKHRHHLLADAQGYQRWRGASVTSYVRDDSETVDQMRTAGVYAVLTPAALIKRCRSKKIRLVTSHPACGGLPAEPSWESLRLVSEVVLPALRPD